MVVLTAPSDQWFRRFEAEVSSWPEAVEAMRAFVPVRVDPDDGEGRPLVARQAPRLAPGGPAILFLDPGNEGTVYGRLVGAVPAAFLPAASLVEQWNTIARLPRDLEPLRRKARPDDGEAMRQLATAMAMQGRTEEAAALVERAWGPGADPHFDRWAAVYNAIGCELMMHLKRQEALDWFGKAARTAKRPIDTYNAHLGAAFAAIFGNDAGRAIQEFEAAARVDGVPGDGREFAREWLGRLTKPPGGAPPVPEAGAAPKRLEPGGPTRATGKSG
jgi:hypothetical protein